MQFPAPKHVSFRKYSNLNFRVYTVRDTKKGMLSRCKKGSVLIFRSLIISNIKGYARARMLALEWKERALNYKKRWFPAAILVVQNCPPIWCLHTNLYKGAWKVSASNSAKTVGHKNLTLPHFFYILVFYESFILLSSSTGRFPIYFFFLVPCLLRDSENEE